LALDDRSEVNNEPGKRFLRIGDVDARTRRGRHAWTYQGASIADLSPRLAVERRCIENDLDLVAGRRSIDELAALDDRDDLRFAGFSLVTQKAHFFRFQVGERCAIDLWRRGGRRDELAFSAHFFERSFVAVEVDRKAYFLADDVGEVDGEAERVVQL